MAKLNWAIKEAVESKRTTATNNNIPSPVNRRTVAPTCWSEARALPRAGFCDAARKWQQQPTTVGGPRANIINSTTILVLVSLVTVLACLSARCLVLALELEDGGSPTEGSTSSTRDLEPRAGVQFYQPSLIGIRCGGWKDDNLGGGLSVVEANKPFLLTLFGESFTRDTIVAFTTEFREEQVDGFGRNRSQQQPKHQAISMVKGNSSRFGNRLRTKSRSYDCTDYNRVVSYKLTQDNILSPNVATLTVTLPEMAPGSEQYYYFCLKQPQLFLEKPADRSNQQQAAGQVQGVPAANGSINRPTLVWVHQGNDWWVTIKVEPPMLTFTDDCILIILLLFLSAVTSGLNLGLMSLDMNELAVIGSSGDQRERSYARAIAPLRKRGNFLLCSLLLGNVLVNSTLTVILEQMTSGVVAVIGSTLAIVVLGEIVPQALCARHGLAIGARTIYLTYAFMLITFPVSYPISCLLDYVLGEEKGNVYDRERLMEFIKITGHHTQLEADEVAIISGALKLKKIKVDQIMTRIEDVFMLPLDCQLDRETIKSIIMKGYSRVPVYEFNNRKQIVALILAKDLALLDPDDRTPIANMLQYCKHPLIFIEDDTTLDVALNVFKTGKSHMAVVRQIYDDGEVDKYYEAIGVVTLEDVIEEVLQAEINDETDTLSDNRRKRRRTDAQLAHLPLIDEPSSGLAAKNANSHLLSNQLTPIKIDTVARSLAVGSSYQQQQAALAPANAGLQAQQNSQHEISSSLSQAPLMSGAAQEKSNRSSEQLIASQELPSGSEGGAELAGRGGPSGESWQTSEAGVLSRAAHFFSNIMP